MTEFTNEEIANLKKDLDKNLEKFFKDNDINVEKPIDIFEVLNKQKFSVYYADLKKFDGAVIIDESVDSVLGFDNNKIMVVNSNLSYEDSVFTLAHELAHFLASKWLKPTSKLQVEFREHSKKGARNDTENLIDFIAASILLPKEPFINILSRFEINSFIAFSNVIEF